VKIEDNEEEEEGQLEEFDSADFENVNGKIEVRNCTEFS
jgi:hypothetical protein